METGLTAKLRASVFCELITRYFKNKNASFLKNCGDRVELNFSAESTVLYTPQ